LRSTASATRSPKVIPTTGTDVSAAGCTGS
jgi:hypothetical protein